MYEPYVVALGHYLAVPLPPWVREVERPDNWRRSAWDRVVSYRPGDGRRVVRKITSDFRSPRGCARGQLVHLRRRAAEAHPDLVEVVQQIGGILIYAIRPRALELFLSIATRQESHAERAGAARREQVPHAVPDHHRTRRSDPQPLAPARNRSGSGLACSTWSRVTIGTPAGMPSISRLGWALSIRPLVPIAHGTPTFVR